MILTTKEINDISDHAKAHVGTVWPHFFAQLYEAAVLAKLCTGVEMPGPVGYLDGQGDAYTLDQLNTVVAAARSQALNDAMHCYSPDDSAADWMDKICALIGEAE